MRFTYKFVTLALFIAYLLPNFGCHTQSQAPLSSEESSASTNIEDPQLHPHTKPYTEYWDTTNVDISKVDKHRKLIALTFDDAPSSALEEIVTIFLDFNATHPDAPATATIFLNGRNIRPTTTDSIQTALTAGFEFGNHTQNHRNLCTLSFDEIEQEIHETDQILQSLDGKPKHLFRAPYGQINETVLQAVTTPIIDWFIDTLDWTGTSAESIYHTVWNNKQAGAIVLMHDGPYHTADALKKLLPDLYKAGYQAVTVSQMAKAHHCPLKNKEVYIRARPKKR